MELNHNHDLILYNIQLHAYVVVELKATPFKPEYMGQLNFYINVVDDTLRGEHDNKTIGLLLCNGGNKVVAQYALSGYDQPIGVSDYQLTKAIPDKLKSALPTGGAFPITRLHFLLQEPGLYRARYYLQVFCLFQTLPHARPSFRQGRVRLHRQLVPFL